MLSLSDPRVTNPVLSSLKIQPNDRIISVKENTHADSNFILTHLMKQILYEKNKICLVNIHNPIDHYYDIGKKLGYDLRKAFDTNDASFMDLIQDITDSIGVESHYVNNNDKETFAEAIFTQLKHKIETLLLNHIHSVTYLLIDDLSHLIDLHVPVGVIVDFVNYCVNLVNNDKIAVILNTHVSNKDDEIISNTLQYVADVHIEVSALKTGRSSDVTGVMSVQRGSDRNHYHYKAFERGIKTFHPGESIYHMYK